MKEKRCYEVPNITVIRVDAQNDIIQTSGEIPPQPAATLGNLENTRSRLRISIDGLFN